MKAALAVFAFGLSMFLQPRFSETADVPASTSEQDKLVKLIQRLTISSPNDWGPTVATGNCVVYLNCAWNLDVVRYRTVFATFAQGSCGEKHFKIAIAMMDANERDKVSVLAQRLVDSHRIEYGLKNLFRAGHVV